MEESLQKYIYKFRVSALINAERAESLRKLLMTYQGIERVDMNMSKRVIRIIAVREIDVKQLTVKLAPHRFHLERLQLPVAAQSTTERPVEPGSSAPKAKEKRPDMMRVNIQGMTCHSCEIYIERKWKKLPGVTKVHVNAGTGQARLHIDGSKPSVTDLQAALGEEKYRVQESNNNPDKKHHTQKTLAVVPEGRPSLARLVGLIASVLFIGYLLQRLNLFNSSIDLSSKMSFATVFIIGLVAAASSCIAVAGGLLLSSMAVFNQRYQSVTRLARMRPVIMFVTGRVIGYALFGGLLGVVGKALVPSPLITGFLIIVAAFYMFVMGMEMLHIAPAWLKRFLPRMSKQLSHRIMDKESNGHPLTPLLLGAGTFFLPCGFTQALQLYALTTGSFGTAALTLFAFALGTAPSLLALGWASGSLKGKFGKLFFQFSGALVMVLGVWNFQNGLNIIGYPVSLGRSESANVQVSDGDSNGVAAPLGENSQGTADSGENVQVVTMKVNSRGYSPSRLTVRAGTPVRWEVDGTNAEGCISVLTSRQLNIQEYLKPGKNIFEFTPTKAGEIAFSCSMGMYRGSFTVLPAS